MNALATVAQGTVADGARVEILAWQPAGPHGTRYRVRSSSDDVEGWLSGGQLAACEPPADQRRTIATKIKKTTPAKRAVVRS